MLEYSSLTQQLELGLPVKRYTDKYLDFLYTRKEEAVPWPSRYELQDVYYGVEFVSVSERYVKWCGLIEMEVTDPLPCRGECWKRVRLSVGGRGNIYLDPE